jgi:hypothetical protein
MHVRSCARGKKRWLTRTGTGRGVGCCDATGVGATLAITSAFSNSDMISSCRTWRCPARSSPISCPRYCFSRLTLAFAVWKLALKRFPQAQIGFPPANAQGYPSASPHAISASLKIRYDFGVPSKRERSLSLSDLPRVPIRERGPVGLRYQPKLKSPWDGRRLQTEHAQSVGGLPHGRPSGFIHKTKSKRHFCPQRHHEFKELMLTRLESLKPLTRMPLGHTWLC